MVFLPQDVSAGTTHFPEVDLITGLMNEFHSEKHFGPNSKMNPVIGQKLLECYTHSVGLKRLELIVNELGMLTETYRSVSA